MPSRKKAKGKARKAAKEAKAKAKQEDSRRVEDVAANERQEGSLEAQLHRLVISEVAPHKCEHGLIHLSAGDQKICLEFIEAFLAAYSRANVGEAIIAAACATSGGFRTAHQATIDEYAEVYVSKLDTVISMLLAKGTQRIIEERNHNAQLFAALVCYFEDFIAVCLRKSQALFSWAKFHELLSADDHTLVSFYRKRIPCACLDEKYTEVKSIKKMGNCHNLNCSHPDGKVERSKMLSCTRCDYGNYCSVQCQKADWKGHKQICGTFAEMKAAFNSSQT